MTPTMCLTTKQTQWETQCATPIWGKKTWGLCLPAKLRIPSALLRSRGKFMLLSTVSGRKVKAYFNFSCILVPPTGLQILEKPTYVSEGKARVVTCQAMGGFPPPEISWWIGTRQLQPQQTVSSKKLHYIRFGTVFFAELMKIIIFLLSINHICLLSNKMRWLSFFRRKSTKA